jgi:hypothetical protein
LVFLFHAHVVAFLFVIVILERSPTKVTPSLPLLSNRGQEGKDIEVKHLEFPPFFLFLNLPKQNKKSEKFKNASG